MVMEQANKHKTLLSSVVEGEIREILVLETLWTAISPRRNSVLEKGV